MKQIYEVLRVGFEPGTHGLEVQHPNHSATHLCQNRTHLCRDVSRKHADPEDELPETTQTSTLKKL